MKLFNMALHDYTRRPPDTSVVSADDSKQLKRSPLLLRIFHAYILGEKRCCDLVGIHVLLDISWDDLRVAICGLRPIIGTDEAKIRALMRFVGEHHFSEPSIASLSSELARGSICLLKDITTGRQPERLAWYEGCAQNIRKPDFFIRNSAQLWGRFVRSSPHSAALLQDIRGFPSFDSIHKIGFGACDPGNYHNVLQWLKVGVKC
jgi:hypothetical protein